MDSETVFASGEESRLAPLALSGVLTTAAALAASSELLLLLVVVVYVGVIIVTTPLTSLPPFFRSRLSTLAVASLIVATFAASIFSIFWAISFFIILLSSLSKIVGLAGDPAAAELESASPNGWKSEVISFSPPPFSEFFGLSAIGLTTTALTLLKGFSGRSRADYAPLFTTGLLSDFTL